MNRPEELEQCLKSVFEAEAIPDEVIVSDDSPDDEAGKAVTSRYPGAIYKIGPRCGLGSNRNACIRAASSSHLIFIDDDVQVSPTFFHIARQLITSSPCQTLITGYEINYAEEQVRKITPHNIDFWGLQRVPVAHDYRSIVMNAAIFPRSLFEQALFDECLRYGSEEIDMACHAVSLGYQIIYNDRLYVSHYPSPVNREYYRRFIHASRLYATTKTYWQYERSLPKTLAYLLFAPLQLVGSAIRHGDVDGVWSAFQSIALAVEYLSTQPKAIKSIGLKS